MAQPWSALLDTCRPSNSAAPSMLLRTCTHWEPPSSIWSAARRPRTSSDRTWSFGSINLNVSPAFRAFLGRLTARKRASRPASAVEALLALEAPAPGSRPIRPRFLVAAAAAIAVLASIVLPWIAMQKTMNALTASPGANAERVQRAQLEAFERELTEPSKPAPPPPPPKSDHRDVSMGRLLSGAKLRELDPGLPSCYQRAGIELARVRTWPGLKAMQLKLVLHSQEVACDWLPLEVTAFADGRRALHSS